MVLACKVRANFFHFTGRGGRSRGDYGEICSAALASIKFASTLFSVLYILFCGPVTTIVKCTTRPRFVTVLKIIITISTFSDVIFKCLHCGGGPVMFTSLGLLGVFIGVFFGVFFLIIYPGVRRSGPSLIS